MRYPKATRQAELTVTLTRRLVAARNSHNEQRHTEDDTPPPRASPHSTVHECRPRRAHPHHSAARTPGRSTVTNLGDRALASARPGHLDSLGMMCAAAAWVPRRRIPIITTIGEHSLLCYLCSPLFTYFFAPSLQHVANALVAITPNFLAIHIARPPTLLWWVVLPAFAVGFWVLCRAVHLADAASVACEAWWRRHGRNVRASF